MLRYKKYVIMLFCNTTRKTLDITSTEPILETALYGFLGSQRQICLYISVTSVLTGSLIFFLISVL